MRAAVRRAAAAPWQLRSDSFLFALRLERREGSRPIGRQGGLGARLAQEGRVVVGGACRGGPLAAGRCRVVLARACNSLQYVVYRVHMCCLYALVTGLCT